MCLIFTRWSQMNSGMLTRLSGCCVCCQLNVLFWHATIAISSSVQERNLKKLLCKMLLGWSCSKCYSLAVRHHCLFLTLSSAPDLRVGRFREPVSSDMSIISRLAMNEIFLVPSTTKKTGKSAPDRLSPSDIPVNLMLKCLAISPFRFVV